MSVLEHYSVAQALKQGFEARGFAKRHEEWLSKVNPGAAERNRDILHAIKNVGRLAAAQEIGFHAYLVREEQGGPLLGFATIIRGQAIRHPQDSRILTGSDLDYTVAPETKPGIHDAIGEALLKTSSMLTYRDYEQRSVAIMGQGDEDIFTDRTFTVVRTDALLTPWGLVDAMQPIGEPAFLDVPTAFGDDPYKITKGGLAQLYVAERVAGQ